VCDSNKIENEKENGNESESESENNCGREGKTEDGRKKKKTERLKD